MRMKPPNAPKSWDERWDGWARQGLTNTTRTCSSSPHATSRAFIWHEQYKIVVTLLLIYVYLESLSFTGTFAYLCYSAY